MSEIFDENGSVRRGVTKGVINFEVLHTLTDEMGLTPLELRALESNLYSQIGTSIIGAIFRAMGRRRRASKEGGEG